MTDEIRASVNVSCENGFLSIGHSSTMNIDQAAVGVYGGVQEIGTSEEVVAFGDVTTEGRLYLRNLDDTNYLDYGPESGGSMVACNRLPAGEDAWCRMKPGVVLRAQANTAACKLLVALFEN